MKPGKGPRPSPIGPPLDEPDMRGFFRRMAAAPLERQRSFVAAVNWFVLDAVGEEAFMRWLAHTLLVGAPEDQAFALKTLEKVPHSRRGRHKTRFQQVLEASDEDLAARLAAVFGPVLGGAPKPRRRPAEPAKAAEAEDLSKLQAFFNRSGRAR
jgi:hypothetical protein